MSGDKSFSVVDLGELSKPADTLIKKVSTAVGGIFKPGQIKRVAKAEAEASLIRAKSEIEITDLHRRAMHRFVEEEANRQENMEAITEKAIPKLNDASDANQMENDWVTNFFDKSRIVSDNEMQDIWSSVLAGEANAPGTYSKRTVNFLGDLNKKDAELFLALCRFGWFIDGFTPLVFDLKSSFYSDLDINFDSLSHLDSIGLIQFDNLPGFIRTELPQTFEVSYFGQPLILEMPNDTGNQLSIGLVLLTQVGQELSLVCQALRVDGFIEYVKGKWSAYLPNDENTEV